MINLPPDCRPRFFEVDAMTISKRSLSSSANFANVGIFATGFQVVNGTRAHYRKKTLVLTVNEGMHFISRLRNKHLLLGSAGNIAAQIRR